MPPLSPAVISPLAVSPLAVAFPELPPVDGVRLAAGAAGIRYRDRPDLMLAELAPGTTVAGVFTQNRCPGAPVDWCRAALRSGRARALIVNSGNANVFTGRAGREAVKASAAAAAGLIGCPARQVFVASTGVIGEVLAHERLTAALPALYAGLSAHGFAAAARAIMTTDTFPKAATRTAEIGGTEVRISGIAKGSGMIAPDMATMLAFVFTDAKIPAALLQRLLAAGNARSFNAISVDSDTSTSDTLLMFATGQKGHPRPPTTGGAMLRGFRAALNEVLEELALAIVRDGEGAERLVTIEIAGAVSGRSARRIGLAIANSPLVKTAIAGADANWGRIVMAVGKAGEPADRDRLSIAIGGVTVAQAGSVVEGYDEAGVTQHMRGREIGIAVDLGLGRGTARVFTCDLTHRYIDINGSYRS
ncbi:MAG: bifunctional glutamate N-acetyltransferase/amino-acid acetyltransferase ArgJ [Acetobacteraceae bacterium]